MLRIQHRARVVSSRGAQRRPSRLVASLMSPTRSTRSAVLARVVAAVWCVFLAWPTIASAQEPVPFGATREQGLSEGRFFIETIVIEGLQRASPQLLVNQSLLEEGQVYTESELRDAVHRVERLPFVLRADFSLRRGSERGRYQLAMAVEETRRFFFGENLVVTRLTNSVNFDSSFLFREWTISPGGLVGMRFFQGDSNVFFVSAAGDRGFQAGWSRYGVFGGRGVVSLALEDGRDGIVEVFPLGIDPTFSSWRSDSGAESVRLALGMPLGSRTGLRAEARALRDDQGSRRNLVGDDISARGTLDYRDLERYEIEVAWTYDTTDDPVFPGRGLQVDVALDWQSLDADLFALEPGLFEPSIDLPPGIGAELPSTHSEQVRAAVTVAQHWRLAPRLSTSLGARVAIGLGEVDNLPILSSLRDGETIVLELVSEDLELFETQLSVTGSIDLWGPRRTRTRGDLRLELGATFGYDRTSPSLELADNPLYRKTLSSAVVFRNSWGLFRFAFQVADYGRGF